MIKFTLKQQKELAEMHRKFEAGLLLAVGNPKQTIVVPSFTEWVGLNELERDGELPHAA